MSKADKDSKNPMHDEAFLAEMLVQRNANAFFDKFDRSEVQDLLAYTTSSWLTSMDDANLPLQLPSGLITDMKNLTHSEILLLSPVESDVRLDYCEVHQILRELVVGIYCFNQVPSISLDANFDCSTSCQLPPAYYDTRVGQILISVDYMIKALWHGAYMAAEKRMRFSEFWRSVMDIDGNGRPQTKKNIYEEFCSAGLVDIASEPEFDGIYSNANNMDPTYDPNKEEVKNLFMQYADNMSITMTCCTLEVQQYKNLFVYDASYDLSNVVKLTQEKVDPITYQCLQQRLTMHQRLVKENIEKKAEIRKNISYLKLISFLVPFLLGLKKKLKVPDLKCLLQPLSDDKVRTERELPPLMLGVNYKCQHFQYSPDEYFHLHGGIEFDLGTPPLENTSRDIMAAYEEICNTATKRIRELLNFDTTYTDQYSIPVMEFEGKSYHIFPIHLEDFYQTMLKKEWWGAISGIVSTLKPKRLPLTDMQINEQFKKRFGYKKAIKCRNLHCGLKVAAERGLTAIFYTYCRKTPISGLNVLDDSGYSIIHNAALHNRVSIISQLAKAGMNLNQRRSDHFLTEGKQSFQSLESAIKKTGLTALHVAAQCGSLEVLSCLLSLKADYMLHDIRGWMAIHFAAFYGTVPCIRALYRKDSSLLEVETATEYKCTPLLLTAMSGALDAFKYVMSLGGSWKKTDSMGNNIIHLAVLYFHTHILKYVIELNFQELQVWNYIVEMLNSQDMYRTEMAVRCLEVLCVVKQQFWKDIYEAGTIPCLIKLLHNRQVNLQCLASGVLSNISNNVPVAVALTQAEAIPILISLLHSKHPELQSRCSVILCDIAQVDGNPTLIAQMDGLRPLVNLLNGDFEDVLINALNCIKVLSIQNPSNQNSIKDTGGIPLIVDFLSAKSDDLVSASCVAIAELARGNKVIQDAIAKENAVTSLINIIRVKKLNIQVKAAKAIESLADHNAAVQKEFLDRSAAKHISKLLKVFKLEVREQGSITLWVLAGQTWKQQKAMSKQIGINLIIDMLLSPSDKMQYVGAQAVIALCKDSKQHQDELCEGNGIGSLVRLLRSSRTAETTLLNIIKALGTMCIGIALINNPVTQAKIVEEQALTTLIHLLKTKSSLRIKVEVACTLACIVLGNSAVQCHLYKNDEFRFADVIDLLYSSDKDICLKAGYALALFAYNNTMQQFYILDNGGIGISVFDFFLQSEIEADRALSAFQIVVLARVIVDIDQVTLSSRGVTILSDLLYSNNPATIVLAGELLASLAHTRAGIPEAISTLGTVERLCDQLNSEIEEVRVACANALGYLTFNNYAYRHVLLKCRNQPVLYNLLKQNLSKDAKISEDFTEEFKIQRQIGLPSLSLVVNGGPPINPSLWKDKKESQKCSNYEDLKDCYWRHHYQFKSVECHQKPWTADPCKQRKVGLPYRPALTVARPKTANAETTKFFK
ncbi:ankyrin and armadillo repeat-containing protein [Leptodactylus fuscus]|uniref:ankyrin and armadillo repeat-containing protein n=1 Tax=Leptodactylus fuscus TaxID=238119 RepID=UPI003F4EE7A2